MSDHNPKIPTSTEKSPLVDEKEIFAELAGREGTTLFLGRYSVNEVFAILGRKNFFKEAKKRKLGPLTFDLDSSAFPLQRFQIFHREKKPENLIVDLKIKEGIFLPREKGLSEIRLTEVKCLIFEWLTLQNPILQFSESQTPLPGQLHPGLNLSKKVMDIFVYLGKFTGKDCLLAFPAYFHNAVLFLRYFHFLNPEKEGEVLAIRKSFSHIPLKQLAWIIHLNCLRQNGDRSYEWKAEEQVRALTRPLKEYFDSKAYKEKVKKIQPQFRFTIDWDRYNKNKPFK
ncbi:MAG: hypothetical protein WCC06_07510 [Candidatus Aminicenantales bacterium]